MSQGSIPAGCSILIKDTGPDADTAERLFAYRSELKDGETFVCTYGDTLTDLDAGKLLQSAEATGKPITMTVGRPDGRYGEITVEEGVITKFAEKQRPEFYVNRGFFVADTRLFDMWQPSFKSFERDVLPYFVARGDVAAYKADCWFHSVDSVKDLADLEAHLSAPR